MVSAFVAFVAALSAMLLYGIASVAQAYAARRASGADVLRHPACAAGLLCDGLAWVAGRSRCRGGRSSQAEKRLIRYSADADLGGRSKPIAVPSPQGQTRMIVFPLSRSVGLSAAAASSRVATLPMFVRSRPSRTRRTISPS